MKKQFNKLASILICITFAVFLLFLKDRVDVIWGILCTFATILTPFLYAFGIAYVLSFPYRFFHDKVFGRIKAKWFQKLVKPLSLIITYIIVFGILSFMIATLIPQLMENVMGLVKNLPGYFDTFKVNSQSFLDWVSHYGVDVSAVQNLNTIISDKIGEFTDSGAINSYINNISSFVISTGIVFYNWTIAFILSIYMLATKDFLLRQIKRFATAFLPTPWMPTLYEIVNVTDDKCGKFLIGKILDSAIIALLCFITMSVIGLPYALLISIIVGVCNIIPFFGPFIGAIPSALLLLMISPVYCLIFIIMIVVIQQIDGNFIGPKIVGSQVGLVGFWSLFSVLIAGGLFGVAGMILGTPIFAAIYTLVGRKVKSRIEMKGDNAERVLNMNVLDSTSLTDLKARKHNRNDTATDDKKDVNESSEKKNKS